MYIGNESIKELSLKFYNKDLMNESSRIGYGFDLISLGQIDMGHKLIGLKRVVISITHILCFLLEFVQVNKSVFNFVKSTYNHHF
jgi:hypothetical protein